MQPASELKQEHDRLQICSDQSVWVNQANGKLSIVKDEELKLVHWDANRGDLTHIDQSTVVVASPDIGMREAIELKQRSGLPILLVESGRVVGILDDSEFL